MSYRLEEESILLLLFLISSSYYICMSGVSIEALAYLGNIYEEHRMMITNRLLICPFIKQSSLLGNILPGSTRKRTGITLFQ